MEPSEPYFRERARIERTVAGEARSSEARKAHLELAVRYVKVAEALYVSNHAKVDDPSPPEETALPRTGQVELGLALRSTFPLPGSGAFLDLLKVID